MPFRALYAVPTDVASAGRHIAQIPDTMAEVQAWMQVETDGAQELDLEAGCELVNLTLALADLNIGAPGSTDFVLVLVDDLEALGYDEAGFKYLVFLETGLPVASWTPATGGGAVNHPTAVIVNERTWSFTSLAGINRVMIHEAIHALGAVAAAAPNYVFDSHITSPVSDIMWGTAGEVTKHLDPGRDDYYNHGGAWLDIKDSIFLRNLLPVNDRNTEGACVTKQGTVNPGPGERAIVEWVALSDGTVNSSVIGSFATAALQVLHGPDLATAVEVASGSPSATPFEAVNGDTYWFVITDPTEAGGGYSLNFGSPAVYAYSDFESVNVASVTVEVV